MDVSGRTFPLSFALVLPGYGLASHVPETVVGILARSIDKEMFFLVDHIGAVVLTKLKVGCQLYSVCWTSFLAETAHDAS